MSFLFLWILPVSSVFCAFLSNQIRQIAQIAASFRHTFRFLWYFRNESYVYYFLYITSLRQQNAPLLVEGGQIAEGNQEGEDFEAPPVAYGDSPLLVEGAFGPMRASAPTT